MQISQVSHRISWSCFRSFISPRLVYDYNYDD